MKRYLAGRTLKLTCDVLELNLDSILEKCGIQLDTPVLEDFQFSADEIGKLFTALIEEYPGTDIHIRAPKQSVGNIYGTGELAFMVSATLGEALKRMAKMKSWIKPIHYEITDTMGVLKVVVSCTEKNFPMSALIEIACFIYTVNACRYHSGQQILARHIQITETVPHQDLIARELGCEIEIGDSNALTLDISVAKIPLAQTHSFLQSMLDFEISKRISQDTDTALVRENVSISILTKNRIKETLIADFSPESVACYLSLSKRTFERRLSTEGTSYRQILDQTRAEMAIRYLSQTDYTLCEVSYLLGFQEPNSFLRAFKRWYGKTPTEYLNIQKDEHNRTA